MLRPPDSSVFLERVADLATRRGLGLSRLADGDGLLVQDLSVADCNRVMIVDTTPPEQVQFRFGVGIRIVMLLEDDEDVDLASDLAAQIFEGHVRETVRIPSSGPAVSVSWSVGHAGSVSISQGSSGRAPGGTSAIIAPGPWPSRPAAARDAARRS
jgi:hypothetical protein